MSATDSICFTPLTIRGKVWKNRFVVSPMIGMEVENGALRAEALVQLRFYAQGDPAEYIVGETEVSPAAYRGPAHLAFDFHNEVSQAGMRNYARIVKDELGALAVVELCHAGESKNAGMGTPIYGPMGYIRASDGAEIIGMTEDDIAATVADFVYAAKTCKDCGFDGVVIHGGHGWLFHQFFSPATNRRTDRFGGSLENRLRFLLMTLDAVREACGEDFIIECRISGAENNGHDSYALDELVEATKLLQHHCDIIHVSAGMYRDPAETHMMSTIYDAHGCNVPYANAVKAAVNVPVSVVGGINSPALCEDIITSSAADLIVMCRQWVADPDFLHKWQAGHSDEIRGCIRCMRCFPGPFESIEHELQAAMAAGKPYRPFEEMHSCSVNPNYANGSLTSQPPVKAKKRVLVVGGGCAGMQVATTAAQRGHTVLLVEQTARLGGILNFAREDVNKRDLYLLAQAMEAELRRTGAEVRLNTPFSPTLLDEFKPDAVIAALGSSPAMPPIPGLENPIVVQAMELYRADAKIAKQVVVLGGGTVGCETAIHLAQRGAVVTLVEMTDTLCADAYRLHGIKLRNTLAALGVTTLTNTTCRSVTNTGVMVTDAEGTEHPLSAEQVVNALGMKANSCAELEAACKGVQYTAIGDCVRARNIACALDEGFKAAVAL